MSTQMRFTIVEQFRMTENNWVHQLALSNNYMLIQIQPWIWFNLQSPHEFGWVLVTRVSSVSRVATPLFHHQPVLNVHVQRILGHNLDITKVFLHFRFTLCVMDALVLEVNHITKWNWLFDTVFVSIIIKSLSQYLSISCSWHPHQNASALFKNRTASTV